MPELSLIAIDLDGTLLTSKKTVDEATRQEVRSCIREGIRILLVSGRPYCFARMVADWIHPSVGVIASNGAIYEQNKQIIEQPLSQEALQAIIDVMEVHPFAHAFFKGHYQFYTHEPYDKRFLYDHIRELPSSCPVHSYTKLDWCQVKRQAHDILKVLVYDMDTQRLSALRKEMAAIKDITVTDYQAISFDITAAGIDKGSALRSILRAYQIPKAEFLAIGDANNDIPMWKEAGIKAAMGNASNAIQQYCDIVGEDCDHQGVAKLIHHFRMECS